MKVSHEQQAKSICKVCNQQFTNKAKLYEHIKVSHELQDLSICKLCNQQFADKAKLYEHIKVHELQHESLCKLYN